MIVLVDISGCISRFQRAVRAQKILLYMNSNDDSSHIARDTLRVTNYIKYIVGILRCKARGAAGSAARVAAALVVRCGRGIRLRRGCCAQQAPSKSEKVRTAIPTAVHSLRSAPASVRYARHCTLAWLGTA